MNKPLLLLFVLMPLILNAKEDVVDSKCIDEIVKACGTYKDKDPTGSKMTEKDKKILECRFQLIFKCFNQVTEEKYIW